MTAECLPLQSVGRFFPTGPIHVEASTPAHLRAAMAFAEHDAARDGFAIEWEPIEEGATTAQGHARPRAKS